MIDTGKEEVSNSEEFLLECSIMGVSIDFIGRSLMLLLDCRGAIFNFGGDCIEVQFSETTGFDTNQTKSFSVISDIIEVTFSYVGNDCRCDIVCSNGSWYSIGFLRVDYRVLNQQLTSEPGDFVAPKPGEFPTQFRPSTVVVEGTLFPNRVVG
jgi:hypothetical protein